MQHDRYINIINIYKQSGSSLWAHRDSIGWSSLHLLILLLGKFRRAEANLDLPQVLVTLRKENSIASGVPNKTPKSPHLSQRTKATKSVDASVQNPRNCSQWLVSRWWCLGRCPRCRIFQFPPGKKIWSMTTDKKIKKMIDAKHHSNILKQVHKRNTGSRSSSKVSSVSKSGLCFLCPRPSFSKRAYMVGSNSRLPFLSTGQSLFQMPFADELFLSSQTWSLFLHQCVAPCRKIGISFTIYQTRCSW